MKMNMKKAKLLALTLLVFVPVASHALDGEGNTKYLGDIHAGYNTSCKVGGVETYSAAAILGTLQGVQINKYLSAGIGVDAWMLTHYYSGQGLRFGMATFVDLRGYYPVKKNFSPFIDLGLGADFTLKPSPNGASFYCEVGPGFRYKHLGFSCGLQHTAKKNHHFYAKLGIFF